MEIMELAEQGLVANLVVKDHSRLGRNRLVVGQLLEEDFVRLNVRYIAIMDNIDTANGVSDIVPMQDLFNEWHAKNTSDKVRRVMQSRGNAGIPLTTNPPFGYRKDPEDKNKWLIDEFAAGVVHQIFQLSISGLGPTTDKAADLQRFIERARCVTRLTGLTPEIVHEFIEKIVVSKPDKLNGKRHQRVDIYYNTIGLWVAPDPEELEREYLAYYKAMQKRRKKTA